MPKLIGAVPSSKRRHQEFDVVRGAKKPYLLNVEGFVACAKNVGPACDGGLNNRIIIRVAHDGRDCARQFNHDPAGFEKSEVLVDVVLAQRPSCLDVGVI